MSFDPARGEQLGYIVSLAAQGVAWRGRAPAPRVSVLSVNRDGKPWPSVMLADCPTPAPTWREYVVRTGVVVPTVAGKVGPPFEITVEVIFYEGHWGVRMATADTSRTCTG